MTQFNLLPDVKLEYLKASKIKHLVISVSVIITVAALLLTGLLFSLTSIQKAKINSLNTDIRRQAVAIAGHQNLNQILTIKNQITTLTTLHEQEPDASFLSTYLNQIVPVNASISNLTIDFNADTVTLTGSADSLATVNQLVDSLKFATYTTSLKTGSINAFSSVVLSSFSVNQQGANYSITFNFDPTLFNGSANVKLTVPSKVTTRSQLDQPITLFKAPINTSSTSTKGS
jgi:Tfp pilus assembly protein PilN